MYIELCRGIAYSLDVTKLGQMNGVRCFGGRSIGNTEIGFLQTHKMVRNFVVDYMGRILGMLLCQCLNLIFTFTAWNVSACIQ